ncbi:MAG: hypothetical protein SynsKO_25010 [Synoicihabitans sp.]
MERVTAKGVKDLFLKESVVDHYATAAVDIGLWRSEELVLTRVFDQNDTILELGCGAGRIAIGLWELGFHKIMGTDLSRPMIARARLLARKLEYAIPLRVADATRLAFEAETFDGVIFGFNGLMQIPEREFRRAALAEMLRVTRAGGRAVLTTHDRTVGAPEGFWAEEQARWKAGKQDRRLREFGDRLTVMDHGEVYIHIPTREEVREDITAAGWRCLEDAMRSEISAEPTAVEEFSTDCRFWVLEKPLI